MNRVRIFNEQQRFSGETAEIIESAIAKLPPAGLGARILIAAASYLSFPAEALWLEAIERRRIGLESSRVPAYTCMHCRTLKPQTGIKWGYCDVCHVMLSIWG